MISVDQIYTQLLLEVYYNSNLLDRNVMVGLKPSILDSFQRRAFVIYGFTARNSSVLMVVNSGLHLAAHFRFSFSLFYSLGRNALQCPSIVSRSTYLCSVNYFPYLWCSLLVKLGCVILESQCMYQLQTLIQVIIEFIYNNTRPKKHVEDWSYFSYALTLELV